MKMNGQVKSDTGEKQEGIGETVIFLHNSPGIKLGATQF